MLKCYQEYYAFIGGYIENAVVCKESGSNADIGELFIGCNVKINYSILGVEKLLLFRHKQTSVQWCTNVYVHVHRCNVYMYTATAII